ncbi:hypothetical protein SAMN05443668_11936 [Cryptosporangium aurantiacum]|uniref:NAD dependent epimerase/dehydratase family protein n=1 Tax=Cryptosporangium aurantiacum TaxID=134849 RepID=A0A1M7RLB4_9ACTN|nr:hypothetical protein SAMN05443668_11936 [Cryptosporangium aurantiacum]
MVGLARHPPRADGAVEQLRGDVRDPDALRTAFDGADVVVHLAFVVRPCAVAGPRFVGAKGPARSCIPTTSGRRCTGVHWAPSLRSTP